MLGAIPQYIDVVKGFVIGVETDQVSYAENQHKLWINNNTCKPSLSTIQTRENSSLSIGACPSGDIQINIKFPDNTRVVRWFGFDELKKVSSISDSIFEGIGISAAHAEEIAPFRLQLASLDGKVLCQKFSDKSTLIRIIKDGEICHKEIINTFTGKVEEYTVVECSSSC